MERSTSSEAGLSTAVTGRRGPGRSRAGAASSSPASSPRPLAAAVLATALVTVGSPEGVGPPAVPSRGRLEIRLPEGHFLSQ